jgi:hypothetical protein
MTILIKNMTSMKNIFLLSSILPSVVLCGLLFTSCEDRNELGKRCFIWIEGNANFRDYGDSSENIARGMEKIADCGFTDIVVDVRPAGAGGDLLFKNDRCRTGCLPEEIR